MGIIVLLFHLSDLHGTPCIFTFGKIEFDFAHTAADIPPQDNENITRIISGVRVLV